MKAKRVFVSLCAVSLIFLSVGFIFAQQEIEEQTPAEPAVPETTKQATAEAEIEPEIQWVWGEVVSVDTQENEVLVKYVDYDTETEKDITIGVDDKTTFENTQSLNEINPQDTVSIDYILTAEGKNLAQNISVENPETKPVPEEETAVEEKEEEVTPAASEEAPAPSGATTPQ